MATRRVGWVDSKTCHHSSLRGPQWMRVELECSRQADAGTPAGFGEESVHEGRSCNIKADEKQTSQA